MAIEIAGASALTALLDDLTDLALDHERADGLRVRAASAAVRIDREQTAVRLRPLVADPGDDPADEIRAAALAACWPEQISADELFAALTPAKRPTFMGGYSILVDQLPTRLRDGDLAAALIWVAGRLSGQPKTASFEQGRDMLERVLPRAWRSPRRSELIAQIALVLHRLIAAEDHDVDFLDAAEPPEDEAARHELAVALLDIAATDSEAWHVPHLSAQAGGLVRPADLQWLLQCEGGAEDATAIRWQALIRWASPDRSMPRRTRKLFAGEQAVARAHRFGT
jgi:hypothetical protein